MKSCTSVLFLIKQEITEKFSHLEKDLAEIRGRQTTVKDFAAYVTVLAASVAFLSNIDRIVNAILSLLKH